MTLRGALLLALAVSLAVGSLATADPRPSPGDRSTCDHSSVTLASSHRHVNYLHQTYAGCTLAVHIAKEWLHMGCGTSRCNIPYNGGYWSCTGQKTSATPDEWLATCHGAQGTVLIGWVRK